MKIKYKFIVYGDEHKQDSSGLLHKPYRDAHPRPSDAQSAPIVILA